MITTSLCEEEVAFDHYYEMRLARVAAVTPKQKADVLDEIERELLDAELEAAFTRYYATRLAQANAQTPAQKLVVLAKLEWELLEAGYLTSHRSVP